MSSCTAAGVQRSVDYSQFDENSVPEFGNAGPSTNIGMSNVAYDDRPAQVGSRKAAGAGMTSRQQPVPFLRSQSALHCLSPGSIVCMELLQLASSMTVAHSR